MAGQAYGVVVSLLDPVEKDRVVRPSQGIQLVTLHLTSVTIAVAILHCACLVTANSEVLFFATWRKGNLDPLRQTDWALAFGVYVYPKRPATRDPRSVDSARDVVFTDASGSPTLGYPGRYLEVVTVANLYVIANLQAADDPGNAVLFIPLKRISGIR